MKTDLKYISQKQITYVKEKKIVKLSIVNLSAYFWVWRFMAAAFTTQEMYGNGHPPYHRQNLNFSENNKDK